MTTALYRRYRPENFAEVIGQDHVTAPLRQALRSGQVNHAYLFSGPRGCGKTTSARILARILNCEANTEASPTDTPCGTCPSCVELARGGPGSLDVVEIDAASHGGVDDARELRERATFAPARDRFKVFILDEAHMVTPQGFNALLKIVEEPPPHIKFIFATTEPDKVIGTIRSRTHHYPFRLVPPDVLVPYLEQLCASEGVPVGSGVLPLVVRAGGGSVRDTLSVLDQLIAGSGEGGLDYDDAAALLGYTPAALLDDLVEAIAARDGGSAFRVVERVITTGHEPRRFVEDLLERLRDLIVIAASGDAAAAALRDVPADQLARMRLQAQHLGASELSRSADLANAALTEMTGATSPRLHLELLMARLLLPAADDTRSGLGARLDRLERGLPADGAAFASARLVGPGDVDAPGSARGADPDPAPASAPAPGAARGAAAVREALANRAVASAATSAATGADDRTGTADGQPGAAADSSNAADADDPSGADDDPGGVTDRPGGVADEPSAVDDWPTVVDHTATAVQVDDAEGSAARDSAGPTGDVVGAADRDAVEADRSEPARPATSTDERAAVGQEPAPTPESTSALVPAPAPAPTSAPAPATAPPPVPAPESSPAPASVSAATAAAGGSRDTEVLRRRWPEVLETVKGLRRVTWALVDPRNAQVAELDATTLRLSFTTPQLAATFRNGAHADVVARAVRETLGFDVRVEGILGEPGSGSGNGGGRPSGAGPSAAPSSGPGPSGAAPAEDARGGAPAGAPAAPRAAGPAGPGGADAGSASGVDARGSSTGASAAGTATAVAAPPAPVPVPRGVVSAAEAAASWDDDAPLPEPPDDDPGEPGLPEPPPDAAPSARERGMAAAARESAARSAARHEVDEPSPDDPDITSSSLVGAPLVAQLLGGTVIDEQFDDPQG
ncbi:DNA polymerase III subunit gamma and tau [Cellulomonas sp. H30R-01]|uniref:DNA polymerase III subunit gamma and tau n=1 Tax=Cellulomonas sp. H30R-01 TaxID=2704467 RepID=UPI00138B2BDA|nr:DNA polymerase III subunit gamma and tau [Cellulomonas sp. H30R-01]QHT57148.1 DNA polymerase III subunit gamma and tau [Cellulomonas sp. H30R-01]